MAASPCLVFCDMSHPPSPKILILSLPPFCFEHGEKNKACCCEGRVFLITYALALGRCSQILKKYSEKIESVADGL